MLDLLAMPFHHFEQQLLSGQLALRASVIGDHQIATNRLQLKGNDGRQKALTEPPRTLAIGDTFTRVWRCEKPDCHPSLGFDRFEHEEVATKTAAKTLQVDDIMRWHDGRSTASRRYCVADSEQRTIQVQTEPWRVSLGGVNRLIRPLVERKMRQQLPRHAAGLPTFSAPEPSDIL